MALRTGQQKQADDEQGISENKGNNTPNTLEKTVRNLMYVRDGKIFVNEEVVLDKKQVMEVLHVQRR